MATSFPVVVFILPRQSLTYYMIPRDIKEVAFRTIDHLLVIEDLQLCLPYFTSLRSKKTYIVTCLAIGTFLRKKGFFHKKKAK